MPEMQVILEPCLETPIPATMEAPPREPRLPQNLCEVLVMLGLLLSAQANWLMIAFCWLKVYCMLSMGVSASQRHFKFSHCKAVASFTIFHKQICDLKTHVSYRLSEKTLTDLPTCKRNRDSIISFPWYQQIPNINVMGLPQEFYCDESVFLFPKPYYLWKVLCRCRGGLLERNVGVWDSGFSCLSSSNLYITDSSLLYIGD